MSTQRRLLLTHQEPRHRCNRLQPLSPLSTAVPKRFCEFSLPPLPVARRDRLSSRMTPDLLLVGSRMYRTILNPATQIVPNTDGHNSDSAVSVTVDDGIQDEHSRPLSLVSRPSRTDQNLWSVRDYKPAHDTVQSSLPPNTPHPFDPAITHDTRSLTDTYVSAIQCPHR